MSDLEHPRPTDRSDGTSPPPSPAASARAPGGSPGLLRRWLPQTHDQMSADQQRQVRSVLSLGLLLVPVSAALAMAHLWEGRPAVSVSCALTGLAACFVAPFIRHSGRTRLAASGVLGLFSAMWLFSVWLTGGLASSGLLGFALTPLAALLALDARAALRWGCLSGACICTLAAAEALGMVPSPPTTLPGAWPTGATETGALLLALSTFALWFHRSRRELAELIQTNHAIASERASEADRHALEVADLRSAVEQARLESELLETQTEEMRFQSEQLTGAMQDAYEELEQADRRKTHFFQNISHELRTPLTLLLNPLEEVASEHRDDHRLQLAERNARRLLRLVNQLLNFQKLAAGEHRLQLENVDLVRFAWVCGDQIRDTCAGSDIRFHIMLDGKELSEADLGQRCRFIQGEIDALEKIVFNYLSNALKFTPSGGEIHLELITSGEQVRLAVTDTGPGIPKDDQSKLFQVFGQLDGSTTRQTEGTGLGLALARELTEAMEGAVGVESDPGQGSRFFSTFPSIAPPAADQEQADMADFEVRPWLLADHAAHNRPGASEPFEDWAEGDGQRVLVVEDLADMRELIGRTLHGRGYRVATARDAFEGFEKAIERPPELIITDWMMPRKSGIEMIAELRAHAQLARIPVVLLTARSDEEGKLLGTEAGADAFVGKPFNEQELCATVRNLLALKDHERKLEIANRQLQEGVLKRYLPPDLVDAIVQGEQSMSAEPDQRAVTVLFGDLKGFTRATQTVRARKMASLLNEYLAAMTRVIFAHGGTVDKFVGDAVMVLFGAPTRMDSTEQTHRAVACGLAMQEAMGQLSAEWKERGVAGIALRVGIHHGPAVVGNFGSEERVDYTAIGHTVNLASRVEGVCEPGDVFVTAEVVDYLPENCVEAAGSHQLRNIEYPVQLYRVLADASRALKATAA